MDVADTCKVVSSNWEYIVGEEGKDIEFVVISTSHPMMNWESPEVVMAESDDVVEQLHNKCKGIPHSGSIVLSRDKKKLLVVTY